MLDVITVKIKFPSYRKFIANYRKVMKTSQINVKRASLEIPLNVKLIFRELFSNYSDYFAFLGTWFDWT